MNIEEHVANLPDELSNERTSFWDWVKAHKKALITAGISLGMIITLFVGIKNRDSLIALWDSLKATLAKSQQPIDAISNRTAHSEIERVPLAEKLSPRSCATPFDVNLHIRTMAENKHHSAKKAEEAVALGITLLPNQTIVDHYTKNAA